MREAIENMYEMKLHDEIQESFTKIRRVPGGWVYTEFTEHEDYTLSSTFVPYNTEFKH